MFIYRNGTMTSQPFSESFDWKSYLAKTGASAAPQEAFCQNAEIPVNRFRLGQKIEINSPDIDGVVHLATIVNFIGPRICVRLDGCDALNNIYLCVDSFDITPVGTRKKLWGPPLRYSKDILKYRSNCDRLLAKLPPESIAPAEVFETPPKLVKKNMFQVGQKLEAVDLKQPWAIYVATIKKVDHNNVEIHLDGWDKSTDYICSYNSRNLFPLGWCDRAGCHLSPPGPKSEEPIKVALQKEPKTHSQTDDNSQKLSFSYKELSIRTSSEIVKAGLKSSVSPTIPSAKSNGNKSLNMNTLTNGTPVKVLATKSSPKTSPVTSSLIHPAVSVSTAIQTDNVLQIKKSSTKNNKRKFSDEFKMNKYFNNDSRKVKPPLISQNPITTISKKSDNTKISTSSVVNGKVVSNANFKGKIANGKSNMDVIVANDKIQQQKSSPNGPISAISIEEWNSNDVVNFSLKNELMKGLGLASILKHHKIDGKALLILSVTTMTSEMGISLGRALKFRHFIDKIISNTK